MGALLHLKAKSQKGRNRIREHGELWKLVMTQQRVLFSDLAGPWHLVDSTKNPMYGRWIHETEDAHFTIVEKIEVKDVEV